MLSMERANVIYRDKIIVNMHAKPPPSLNLKDTGTVYVKRDAWRRTGYCVKCAHCGEAMECCRIEVMHPSAIHLNHFVPLHKACHTAWIRCTVAYGKQHKKMD